MTWLPPTRRRPVIFPDAVFAATYDRQCPRNLRANCLVELIVAAPCADPLAHQELRLLQSTKRFDSAPPTPAHNIQGEPYQ